MNDQNLEFLNDFTEESNQPELDPYIGLIRNQIKKYILQGAWQYPMHNEDFISEKEGLITPHFAIVYHAQFENAGIQHFKAAMASLGYTKHHKKIMASLPIRDSRKTHPIWFRPDTEYHSFNYLVQIARDSWKGIRAAYPKEHSIYPKITGYIKQYTLLTEQRQKQQQLTDKTSKRKDLISYFTKVDFANGERDLSESAIIERHQSILGKRKYNMTKDRVPRNTSLAIAKAKIVFDYENNPDISNYQEYRLALLYLSNINNPRIQCEIDKARSQFAQEQDFNTINLIRRQIMESKATLAAVTYSPGKGQRFIERGFNNFTDDFSVITTQLAQLTGTDIYFVIVPPPFTVEQFNSIIQNECPNIKPNKRPSLARPIHITPYLERYGENITPTDVENIITRLEWLAIPELPRPHMPKWELLLDRVKYYYHYIIEQPLSKEQESNYAKVKAFIQKKIMRY